MALARAMKNIMRGKSVPKTSSGSASIPETKQYNHTGKKYTGPNYPQKDTGVSTSGVLK